VSGEHGVTTEMVQTALRKCEELEDGRIDLSPITNVLEMVEKGVVSEPESQAALRHRTKLEETVADILITLLDPDEGIKLFGTDRPDWTIGEVLEWLRDPDKSSDLRHVVGTLFGEQFQNGFQMRRQVVGKAIEQVKGFAAECQVLVDEGKRRGDVTMMENGFKAKDTAQATLATLQWIQNPAEDLIAMMWKGKLSVPTGKEGS
jgi:hypothetical protein